MFANTIRFDARESLRISTTLKFNGLGLPTSAETGLSYVYFVLYFTFVTILYCTSDNPTSRDLAG